MKSLEPIISQALTVLKEEQQYIITLDTENNEWIFQIPIHDVINPQVAKAILLEPLSPITIALKLQLKFDATGTEGELSVIRVDAYQNRSRKLNVQLKDIAWDYIEKNWGRVQYWMKFGKGSTIMFTTKKNKVIKSKIQNIEESNKTQKEGPSEAKKETITAEKNSEIPLKEITKDGEMHSEKLPELEIPKCKKFPIKLDKSIRSRSMSLDPLIKEKKKNSLNEKYSPRYKKSKKIVKDSITLTKQNQTLISIESDKNKEPDIKSDKDKEPDIKSDVLTQPEIIISDKGKEPDTILQFEDSNSEEYMDISNLTVKYDSNDENESLEEETKSKAKRPSIHLSDDLDQKPDRKSFKTTIADFFNSLGKKITGTPPTPISLSDPTTEKSSFKQETKKEKPVKEDDDEMDEEPKEKKTDHPFKILDKDAPTPFVMDTWKKTYSNCEGDYAGAMKSFWETFDSNGWSLWRGDYNYNTDCAVLFMTSNLIGGFIQRTEEIRKWLFGTMTIRGKEEKGGMKISAYFLIRGQEIAPLLQCNDDAEYYTWTKVPIPASDNDKALIFDYWSKDVGDSLDGESCLNSRCYK